MKFFDYRFLPPPTFLVLVALFLGPWMCQEAVAQKGKKNLCTVCQHDQKLLEKWGMNHGPFIFGPKQSTEIEEDLAWKGLWLETPHFRIGFSLKKWKIPNAERKIYWPELLKLKEKFPKVKGKINTLDSWHRLHLFAERSEAIYEEFLSHVGRTQKEFDTLPPESVFYDAFGGDFQAVLQEYDLAHQRDTCLPRFLGVGRYLGQPMKFEVLLTQTESLLGEYKRSYLGITQPRAQKWNNKVETINVAGETVLRTRALWFGISADAEKIKHDQHMHNALRHNIAMNLMDGYMLYLFEMPVWLSEGYAHYMRRLNTKDWNFYDAGEGSSGPQKDAKKWAPLVRKLVKQKKTPSFAKFIRLNDYVDLDFNGHLCAWSWVDFLFAQGDGQFGKFLTQLAVQPAGAGAAETQRDAFRDIFGWTIKAAEENWQTWVMKNYPTQ